MESMLETKSLTLGYHDTTIIENLDIQIPKGEITVFIGANGCGKSTLLRSMARLLKPKSGAVYLSGKELTSLNTKDIAKKLGILPQSPISPEGLTVFELVKQGRYPYQNWLSQWSQEDQFKVSKALKDTETEDLRDRLVDELSGGQRQRAWIAMTLAQDTDILLLDEPTTYLDMAHQIEVLDLLFELNEKENRTIVMVLHDLNLACRYAHHLVAIKDRTVFAQGRPEDIMKQELVKMVFNMDCFIIEDPLFGTPMCVPHGKGRSLRKGTSKDGLSQSE
jgi:iron complex transport system ATP-binding protein